MWHLHFINFSICNDSQNSFLHENDPYCEAISPFKNTFNLFDKISYVQNLTIDKKYQSDICLWGRYPMYTFKHSQNCFFFLTYDMAFYVKWYTLFRNTLPFFAQNTSLTLTIIFSTHTVFKNIKESLFNFKDWEGYLVRLA